MKPVLIDEELHRKLKAEANGLGVTIKDYVAALLRQVLNRRRSKPTKK